ncbi:MAG: META domain-containing protein, partial [Chloroflexota bacterium]|nr:META domain-containing protein [Chloroflexota bacterium]
MMKTTRQLKKNSHWIWLAIAVLLMMLPLSACKTTTPTSTPPEASQPSYRWGEVADRIWVLVGYGDALNPTVVEEGAVITAMFSSVEPQVSGSGGCNNYFAGYSSDNDGGLTIDGPIGTTMMACEQGGEQEAAYLVALETVSGYEINKQGRLELAYSSGQSYEEKLVYAPGETPLTGTTWQLVSYGDPNDLQRVAEGTAVTAIFSPETDTSGTLAGNATCNGYTTSYTLDGDKITVGPTASTQTSCPAGAKQETAYLAALGSSQAYEIVGSNLRITVDGGLLNYTSLKLPLEHILWQAEMIVGELVPADVAVTLLFTPDEKVGTGTVSGNAACGVFRAGYKSQEGDLSITGRMNTSMADCPGGSLNQVQRWYLQTLSTASGYEILGDRMVLNTREGDIVFAADREPLVGTTWTLVSLGDIGDPQPPVEGSHFTAQFSRLPNLPSGVVEGETGCNDYNAIYTANLNEIKINLPTKSDNEDCPWGTGNYEVEQQFFLGLNAATEYRIIGDILQIPYGEKDARQMLSFIATPTEVAEALDLSPLHDTFWHLTDIGDGAVLPGTEVTAKFAIDQGG